MPPGASRAEQTLLRKVRLRTLEPIRAACQATPLPCEFLVALTANESGGNPQAARFEPAVYRHLLDVSTRRRPIFGAVTPAALDAAIARVLGPQQDSPRPSQAAATTDAALRQLATSWGFTQIMGYHMVNQPGTVRDLLDPAFHFRFAVKLLLGFSRAFHLDPARDVEALFRCWNTGRPDGATFDPAYVSNGLRRMHLCRELPDDNARAATPVPASNAKPAAR